MSEQAPVRGLSRWALAMVLVAVLVLLLVLGRRDGGDDGAGATAGVAEGLSEGLSEGPPAAAPVPSDDAFCAGYRRLAAAQGQHLAQPGETGAQELAAAAADLVATGVPASMSPLVRTGYRIEISGVYDSLGDTLPGDAVPGALEDDGRATSVSGVVGAFGDWLAQYCPAR
ncbi:hypothetical protein RB608_14460 [Nocardioides sp. LHD-245]|uniref:hypothetical protein n=1 Tax=Nocardioides sp. LHD-245 TaxID=3051387 RepID=UPI0027E0515A|nr:hypothetical protein [Nocardioides sp. LHD-245]